MANSCERHDWKQTEQVRGESAAALLELMVYSAEYATVLLMESPGEERLKSASGNYQLAINKAVRLLRRFKEADWREQTGWVKPEPGGVKAINRNVDETQAARELRRKRAAGRGQGPNQF